VGWTFEEKLDATIRGPRGPGLHRPDTTVIEIPGWYQVITPSTKGETLNEISYSELPEDEADRVIDRVVTENRSRGVPTKWCVGPWTKPENFGRLLEDRGFTSWDVRGMAIDTSTPIDPVGGVSVVDVDEAGLDAFLDALVTGWSLESIEDERSSHLLALRAEPRVAHFFSAVVGGEVAGTCGLLLRGRYAYFVGGLVLEPYRGRGIYRAMVRERLAFLAKRGIGLAVVHARESTSAPILERLGFETMFRSKVYRLDA
jgi:ribosomal protein S18 acetylase RimI-like enzyme